MSLARKLDDWQQAGLIDRQTALRIAAHEAGARRPVAIWAVVGLGCLALGLGIISLVAANWDRIPDLLKLGVHLALTIAVAGIVWWREPRGSSWVTEGALFVLGALILAGIGLQAQIYQLVGPLHESLLFWLLLASPVLLIAGRTLLTAYGWALMTLWTLGALAADRAGESAADLAVQGIAIGGPALLILVAALLSARGPARPAFVFGIGQIGIVSILIGASAAHMAWASPLGAADAEPMAWRLAIAAPVMLAAYAAARHWEAVPPRLAMPLLVSPWAAVFAATAIPHPDGWLPRLIGALIFGAMWGWIALAANAERHAALFGLAIAALALRLFIVYFELFGSLAMTGLGLIAAGGLLILLAFAWQRLVRRWKR